MSKADDNGVRRTKKSLQNALFSLMMKYKFQEITITEIVNEAAYSRGTFYFHYAHKEALLNEMIDNMLMKLEKAFQKPYKSLDKEVNINELSTTALIEHFLNNKQFYKLMLNTNSTYDFREKMIKTLENLLKNDISFSENDVEAKIDHNLFITYRASGIIGIIWEWINNDFVYTKSYMAEQIITISTFHTKKIYFKRG